MACRFSLLSMQRRIGSSVDVHSRDNCFDSGKKRWRNVLNLLTYWPKNAGMLLQNVPIKFSKRSKSCCFCSGVKNVVLTLTRTISWTRDLKNFERSICPEAVKIYFGIICKSGAILLSPRLAPIFCVNYFWITTHFCYLE